MAITNRLGELMAERRRLTGERLSQDDLAAATGIAQSTISAYVTNRTLRYDVRVVARLLEYFGVGLSDFFVYDPDEIEKDRVVLAAS